jgi:hypothetical protein
MSARRPSPRQRYAAVTETAFQTQVIDLAHLNGWKVAHFRTARVGNRWMTPVAGDGKGWPDLFLVHPPTDDVLAVELKKEYGSQVTPEQSEWLTWLKGCQIETAVWRPSMIDAVIARLRKAKR